MALSLTQHSGVLTLTADHLILTAGVYGTPEILQCFGIGDPILYHLVGTCAMGVNDDAVCNSEGRVAGLNHVTHRGCVAYVANTACEHEFTQRADW